MSVCDIAGVGNLYKKNVIKCLENINLNVWLGIHWEYHSRNGVKSFRKKRGIQQLGEKITGILKKEVGNQEKRGKRKKKGGSREKGGIHS